MHSLLVVDDEPGIRALVSRWAEASGFTVRQASCAGDALDQMAAHPADVALCDISMPDRDGFWLAAQLQQQFPQTAVVMVSGFSEMDQTAAQQKGAVGHLPKPFGRQQLLDMLKRAVDHHAEKSSADYANPPSALPIPYSSRRR